jgi:hypothetical protein
MFLKITIINYLFSTQLSIYPKEVENANTVLVLLEEKIF